MSTIIAFDTSSETASVSLLRNGHVQTHYSTGVSTHSQALLPMLHALFDEAGVRLSDCDAIAFGCGPGSFTGVRTACSAAQGLGFGSALPLVPIVSLLAMAESCRMETGATDVLAILDARMHEVYWAQYRHEAGRWQTVTPPCITPAADVLPVGNPVACGNGLSAYADDFAALTVAERHPGIFPDSASIVHLAEAALQAGETCTASEAQPLYLRNRVAYTTEERERMKRGEA